MMIIRFSILFILVIANLSLINPAARPTYIVKRLPAAGFRLDGNLDDEQWKQCTTIKDLMSPWVHSAKDYSIFRAFHDNEFFYFSYIVKDSSMTVNKYVDETTVEGEDRVEMFLTQSLDMKPYFGFEMDPQGKMLDYEGGTGHDLNYGWNVKVLSIRTKQHRYGYELEAKLPLSFIRKIAIKNASGLSVYAGVFRGDYYGEKPDDVIWFSWLRSQSVKPNFHIPSSFGIFVFEKAAK